MPNTKPENQYGGGLWPLATNEQFDSLHPAARRDPFSGIGKPEPLLGSLSGYWSRRIDETHRLVYAADDADLDVIACRGHYE